MNNKIKNLQGKMKNTKYCKEAQMLKNRGRIIYA